MARDLFSASSHASEGGSLLDSVFIILGSIVVHLAIQSQLRVMSAYRISASQALFVAIWDDEYSPSKSYANYPAHPSLGQKRFNAALNLLKFHLSRHSLRNRWWATIRHDKLPRVR